MLVLVFSAAFWAHFQAFPRFVEVLQLIGFGSSSRLVAIAATITDAAIVVLVTLAPIAGGGTALLYLIVATGMIGRSVIKGTAVEDCGCGSTPKPADTRFFVRNGILVMLAGLAVVVSPAIASPSQMFLVSSVAVLYSLLARRGEAEDADIHEAVVEAGSRRQFLSVGAKGVGVGLAFSALPSAGLAKGAFPGLETQERSRREHDVLLGQGARADDVRSLRADYPNLDALLPSLPEAAYINWDAAVIFGSAYSTEDVRLLTQSVYVPVHGAGGKTVAELVRHSGLAVKAPGSKKGEVTLETRPQFVYSSEGKEVVALLSPDGSIKVVDLDIPRSPGRRDHEDLSDICEGVWDSLDEVDSQSCGKCSFYAWQNCGGDGCFIYKCKKRFRCGNS
jgi:hypothetical protein